MEHTDKPTYSMGMSRMNRRQTRSNPVPSCLPVTHTQLTASAHEAPTRRLTSLLNITAREKKKEGKNVKDTKMRVFRIGFKGNKYRVTTPLAERYENNWEFRKF